MTNIRNHIQPIASLFSLNSLVSLSGQRLVLPFYHAVSDEELPHISALYPHKSVASFIKDLDTLLQYFEPIDLQQLIQLVQNKEQPRKPVFHLSFDDGLREVYEIVRPILLDKGIPATAFINTAFIDNKALFYRYGESLKTNNIDPQEFLNTCKPYMSTQQIRQWLDDGFTIGGHSVDHPLYSTISLNEQVRQTMESVDHLQEQFKLNYRAFAFPFTDDGLGRKLFDLLHDPDAIDLDISFGTAGLKQDINHSHLQRIPMEGTGMNAEQTLKAEYLYYLVKMPLGKNQILRS